MIKKQKLQILLFLNSFFLISCSSNRIARIADEFDSVYKNQLNSRNAIALENNNIETFSIAIIPDTQSYIEFRHQHFLVRSFPINQWEIFYRQTKFIADNSVKNGGTFAFAVHVGDLVQSSAYVPTEWILADKCMRNLNNEIPFLTVPGNHDYDQWNYRNEIKNTKRFNSYFGPESIYFKDKEWYKGSYKGGCNSYAIMKGGSKDFLLIALEVEPSEDVIAWAQDIINKNQNLPVIVLTHEYISHIQNKETGNNYFSNSRSRAHEGGLSPEELWKRLISVNDRIFLVICGHCGSETIGSGCRIDKNMYDNSVYTVLSDFQFFRNYFDFINIQDKKKVDCGDGWMTILNFNLDEKKISLKVYNTETGKYLPGEINDKIFPIDWDWNARFYSSSN